MSGKNANIYFSEKTYDKLRQVAGARISRFVNEAVEEKLITQEQQTKEKLQQQLTADYQSIVKSKQIQEETGVWDETVSDMWKNNEQQ